MGVPVGDAEGEYLTLLKCKNCGEQYETDETMVNMCPHCEAPTSSFEIISDDYSGDWRTDA